MARTKKKFQFESVLSERKADIVEESLGTIVDFPDRMIKKISQNFGATGVIGLCGSAGTGKKTILRQASSVPVREYRVDRSLGTNHLSELKTALQHPLDGPCIWIVHPAELLTEGLVNAMAKYTGWQTKIVLVGNEKIKGLDKVVYHKVPENFMREVAIEIGATLDDINACCGDLRQLQLTKMLDKCGGLDKAPHVYFDTMAILNRKIRPTSGYSTLWLEENVLASTNDLESATAFYANLAETDTMGLFKDDEDSAMHDLQAQVLKLSLPNQRRAPSKLMCPHKFCSKAYSPHKNYPQARRRGYMDYAKYLANNSEEEGGPMCLSWNYHQGRFMFERGAPPPRDIEVSEDEAPPKKKARTVVHDSTPAPGDMAQKPTPVVAPLGQAERVEKAEYDLLQGLGLYRTSLRTYDVPADTATTSSTGDYKPAPTDLKQAHWLRIEYPAGSEPGAIANAFESNLPEVLFDVSSTRIATVVFVYKPNQQNIKSRLTLGALAPTRIEVADFKAGQGRAKVKKAQRNMIENFQRQPGKHASNMFLGKHDEVAEYTAKTLYEEVKDMSAEDYAKYVVDAILKMEKGGDLTELERLLCVVKIESRVKELRKLSGTNVTNVIYASKIKELGQVQPEAAFKSSWRKLVVTIHDESLLTPTMPRIGNSNKVTVTTFLDFPELHQNVTLFIPGDTGMGKSELAKYICLVMALSYHGAEARFLMTNTLDSLRNNQSIMLPGVPVLLDDIGGDSDEDQLIYSSISIWKAILQVKDATQNRARNDDLMWAARQPKVLTTNCENLEDWIKTLFPRSKESHKRAIIRRVAEVETITESLYANVSAPSGTQKFLPRKMTRQEASEAIASLCAQ